MNCNLKILVDTTQEEQLFTNTKANNVLLQKDAEEAFYSEQVKRKMNVRSVAALYFSSVFFKSPKMFESSLRFTERRFQVVAASRDFLELDFKNVIKIISSDELNIDSELEVVYAADAWLSHDAAERCKFARRLLLRVRLHLLSDCALEHVLEQTSCFSADEGCARIIREALNSKKIPANVASRYCSQNDFDFIFCGGYLRPETIHLAGRGYLGRALTINAVDCANVKRLPRMKQERMLSQAVRVKDQVFAFGGCDEELELVRSVEKYSRATGGWQVVAGMRDGRRHFCACSLVDSVYVIGGLLENEETSSCLGFDAKSCEWREVARMREARFYAGCCAFQGRVVASGGQHRGEEERMLNSVEVYDHVRDAWTGMPSMIQGRKCHKQVAVGSKLYVVGGFSLSLEVFDWISGKFSRVKTKTWDVESWMLEYVLKFPAEVFAIGRQLVLFGHGVDAVFYYDVTSNEWRQRSCEIADEKSKYYCGVKMPHA